MRRPKKELMSEWKERGVEDRVGLRAVIRVPGYKPRATHRQIQLFLANPAHGDASPRRHASRRVESSFAIILCLSLGQVFLYPSTPTPYPTQKARSEMGGRSHS